MVPLFGVRGTFFHFIKNPFLTEESKSYQYLEDGLLIIENGKVKELGPFSELKSKYQQIQITHYKTRLIIPGFVDTHVHYPQTGMIASYGKQLLEWLNAYTFPMESRFKEKAYAKKVASFFLDELLKNGTTTALIFATVHPESVDAIFEEADQREMRIIAGKVLMDRNEFVPKDLQDTPETASHDTQSLIQKWHGRKRLLYAITPRFAITSSEEQLERVGQLKREYPEVYLQTHLAENQDEMKTVQRLYPKSKGYLDVYDRFRLLGPRSVFAHSIHLESHEFQRLSESHSSIAFCPTSNLFLGSGLFKIAQATTSQVPIKIGLGTDVGAGTSFSLLHTMSEAYKVCQLQKYSLSAFKAFYLSTLGGAEALSLDRWIGNFLPGKEVDFVVLDLQSTGLQAFKMQASKEVLGEAFPESTSSQTLHDLLFTLMTLGDDRAVEATYVCGQLAYQRKTS